MRFHVKKSDETLKKRWVSQSICSLKVLGAILLLCVGAVPLAHSETYYLAPNGTNSNFRGSSEAPWQTFDFAIPKLQPGDVLILKNGTYRGNRSEINCSLSAKNGTSVNPITIKAENERQAFINGTGSYPTLTIRNCSNWKLEGLRASGKDNRTYYGNGTSVIKIVNSRNLALKRLLLTHNNRYTNSHLLNIQRSTNILVEESEFYSFHRHAILNWHSNNNTYQRNYFNSRGHRDVHGGFKSLNSIRGDMGISIYPGSNTILENNISEGNVSVADIQATEPSVGNKFLGNISLNDLYGLVIQARGIGNKMPMNTFIENHASITPTYYGIFARGTKNTLAKNITVLGGKAGIVADFESVRPGDGIYSFFSTNALLNNTYPYGFYMKNQKEFSHKFPAVYKPWRNFLPNFNYFNEITIDPKLGTCKVFIPELSPLKGNGEGGADIGANILYRYEDGVLTNQPLWDSTTSEFPHGVLVPGINDIAGSSAFDVHKRLNVNTNGCLLP